MGAQLQFYLGVLLFSSLVCMTISSEDAAEVMIEQPVQQDTGEPYNSETDLETQSLDEPGPIIPGKSIVDEFHPIPNDPHTDKEAQAVAGGQPETGDEPVNTGGEPVNTGGEPVNTGGEPGETDQMQADIVNTDIETNIADVDIMDMETKRVGDSMTNPIVNTKVEIDDGIDPYEELDMMFQMKLAGLHNASEFCQMLDIDCEGQLFTSRVMRKPIFRVYEQVRHEPGLEEEDDGDGEKVLVSGGSSQVALFDACNPREQTVALPKDGNPDISIWPTCTRALRCGGCCTSDVFSCEPTETRERFVRVFRTRQPYKGAQRFQFIDAKSVKIIEHTRCDAQCKVKAIHCNPLQKYQSRYCRCVCTNQNMRKTCTTDQIWDDNECACVCPQRKTTFCPHPSRFSDHLCKCTLMQEVAGEIDLALLLANYGSNIVVEPNNEITKAPTTPPPTTTTTTTEPTTTTPTTTTTTTAAPTTPDRCGGMACPPKWRGKFDPKRFKNNGSPYDGCRCFPAIFLGGK